MSSGPSMANSISNAPRFMYPSVNMFQGRRFPILNNPVNVYVNRQFYDDDKPDVVKIIVWSLAAYGVYNLIKTD